MPMSHERLGFRSTKKNLGGIAALLPLVTVISRHAYGRTEVSRAPRRRRSRTAAASAATCTDERTDGRLDGRRAQTGTQFLRTRGEERGEDGSLLCLRSVTRAVRGCELGYLRYPETDQTPDSMSEERIGRSLLNPCTTSRCGKGVVGDCNGVIGVRLRSI